MSKAILFISLVFFFHFPASAQTAPAQSRDEASIRKMMASQVTEWNKGNIDGFMSGYWENDSLIFIGSSGAQYGYNTTLARYKAKYPDVAHMGKLALTIISIKQLSGDHYFVIGKWALKRTAGDVDGSFSLLIKRINGELKIVVDHSS